MRSCIAANFCFWSSFSSALMLLFVPSEILRALARRSSAEMKATPDFSSIAMSSGPVTPVIATQVPAKPGTTSVKTPKAFKPRMVSPAAATSKTAPAVMAVLGYSVNESVVVFDRIRENFRKMRRASVPDIINNAITRTMSRGS